MSLLRVNSISMRWLDSGDFIGIQDAESKRDCDAKEMSGEDWWASELKCTPV